MKCTGVAFLHWSIVLAFILTTDHYGQCVILGLGCIYGAPYWEILENISLNSFQMINFNNCTVWECIDRLWTIYGHGVVTWTTALQLGSPISIVSLSVIVDESFAQLLAWDATIYAFLNWYLDNPELILTN